jgi:hypothetical protein
MSETYQLASECVTKPPQGRHSGCMFDNAYAAAMTERYASRPEWTRPSHYVLATSPTLARQRERLNRVLGAMPLAARDRYITRLRADPTFLAAHNELAVAGVFLERGFDVQPEPDIGGLTPDFLVRTDDDEIGTIVEVYTRHRSDVQLRAERRWLELKIRAREIDVPVANVARVPEGSNLGAPDSKTCVAVIKRLKHHLLSLKDPPGTTVLVEGYIFHVFSAVQAGLGTQYPRATMSTPRPLGWHDADQVLEAVGEKVSKYADLAQTKGLRLVVVLSAERESTFTADLLRVALTGAKSVVFNLDIFGPSSTGPYTTKILGKNEIIQFDAAVSGVGWLASGSQYPGPLSIYRIGSAAIILPWIASGNLAIFDVVTA